jgi:four helix bundle protein
MIALTDLDVYKLGEEISDMIWNDYDHWPEKAQRTIGYQIIRSSDSISINIAEGYGRFTPADRKNFFRYSRGSFEETKGWLRKAFKRKLISKGRLEQYKLIIETLGPKLNAFINSTNKYYGK